MCVGVCVVITLLLHAGLLAGPLLWLCINAAVALRTGNAQQFAAAFTDGLGAADAAAADVAASPGMLLLGVGAGGIVSMQQVLLLLVFAAASPAGKRFGVPSCQPFVFEVPVGGWPSSTIRGQPHPLTGLLQWHAAANVCDVMDFVSCCNAPDVPPHAAAAA